MKKPELESSSLSLSSAVSKQPAWPWPYYCHHCPRTLSFRIPGNILETLNSSAVASSSSSPPPPASPTILDMISLESVIRSARSDRLFFDPSATSSSILNETSSSLPRTVPEQPVDNDEKAAPVPSPYGDSVFLSVDSRDPLLDFRESMLEMVTAHGIKDWDGLVELLWCYLKVNDEANHSYIYGAFIDLSFSQAIFSVNSAEANSSSSCESSAETLPSGPPCARHYSPSSPLSLDTSSSSASSSSSSSSLSTRCVSGLEIEDYDK